MDWLNIQILKLRVKCVEFGLEHFEPETEQDIILVTESYAFLKASKQKIEDYYYNL